MAKGGGHVWQEVCMAGGCVWQGGMHGGAMRGRGVCMAGETATAAGATHPT